MSEYIAKGVLDYSIYSPSQKNASENAFKLFKKASKQIPAYKHFLKRHGVESEKIRSKQDLKLVPETSKENYILKYSVKDRSWNSRIELAHTIAASSGSTGEPIFWPREIEQEIEGAKIHKYIFDKAYDFNHKRTLFVNSFGLGNWIAGLYTEFCVYLLRLNKYKFTLASPGYNQDETLKIIKNFSKYYDQTIIACHPPVIKMIVEKGLSEGVNWKKINVKFLGAGEGFSENWRDYLLGLVGQTDAYKTMLNIYGSADAGLMGFETPLSIAIHRITTVNHELNARVFGSERSPYLYQFDPRFKYIESNNNKELMITADATAPLIKYNIHDRGLVLEYQTILKHTVDDPAFNEKSKDISAKDWKYPFVAVYGRDKFMTSLYGVNIYPENIKSIVEHPVLQPWLTGRYVLEKKSDNKMDQYLFFGAELKGSIKESQKMKSKISELFISILKKMNSEYNQVEMQYGSKAHPKVMLISYQDPHFFPEGKIKKMA